jgi:hypothetical protein
MNGTSKEDESNTLLGINAATVPAPGVVGIVTHVDILTSHSPNG